MFYNFGVIRPRCAFLSCPGPSLCMSNNTSSGAKKVFLENSETSFGEVSKLMKNTVLKNMKHRLVYALFRRVWFGNWNRPFFQKLLCFLPPCTRTRFSSPSLLVLSTGLRPRLYEPGWFRDPRRASWVRRQVHR